MEITVTTEPAPLDRSLLDAAEELLSQSPAPSPFALSDDHEFKPAQQKTPEAVIRTIAETRPKLNGTVKTGRMFAEAPAASPLPGTPESPYRKCPCLAVMPGRTCNRCLGSKWVKACPKCDGQGRTDMSRRKGSERSQPCGFCMATGQVSAGKVEIARAEEAARFAASAPSVVHDEVPIPAFRRAARLPGIGVTEKKRKGRPGRRPKKQVSK